MSVAALSFAVALPALAKEQCFLTSPGRLNGDLQVLDKKGAALLQESRRESRPYKLVTREAKGTYVGVGVVLDEDKDGRHVAVADVLPGSRAAEVLHLERGDATILAVDGDVLLPHTSVQDVAKWIRGDGKVGSGVVLSVRYRDSRVFVRYLERKRFTVMTEKTFVCFEKKGR